MHHPNIPSPIAFGSQSQVYLQPVVVKDIGIGKGLTQYEAHNLTHELYCYQSLLRAHHWRIPRLYNIDICSDNDIYLRQHEEYIPGKTLGQLTLQKAMPFLHRLAQQLALESVEPVTYNHTTLLHQLPYGIDLKPANLVVHKDQLVLVDTFAPKTLDSQKAWRCYSQKLERLTPEQLLIVTATREGALLRLLRLLNISYSFAHDLLYTTLAENEREFILQEITHDYPLLNAVYSE